MPLQCDGRKGSKGIEGGCQEWSSWWVMEPVLRNRGDKKEVNIEKFVTSVNITFIAWKIIPLKSLDILKEIKQTFFFKCKTALTRCRVNPQKPKRKSERNPKWYGSMKPGYATDTSHRNLSFNGRIWEGETSNGGDWNLDYHMKLGTFRVYILSEKVNWQNRWINK